MKEYRFTINGKSYDVVVNGIEANTADVTVNGINHKVGIEETAAQAAAPVRPADTAAVTSKPAGPAPSGGRTITAPLPGVIIEISVKEGQTVKSGDKVAVLEAMKMENDILAESDGTVTAIHVSTGDSVLEGAKVVTIG